MKNKKDEKDQEKKEKAQETPPKKIVQGSLEDYQRIEREAEAQAKAEGRETWIGLF